MLSARDSFFPDCSPSSSSDAPKVPQRVEQHVFVLPVLVVVEMRDRYGEVPDPRGGEPYFLAPFDELLDPVF
jgi:hypothetical protein